MYLYCGRCKAVASICMLGLLDNHKNMYVTHFLSLFFHIQFIVHQNKLAIEIPK